MNDAFKLWLKKNALTLRKYSPDQIAYFALMNDFSRDIVFPGVCDQVTHLKRLLTFWESPLAEQWMNLTNYERGIE